MEQALRWVQFQFSGPPQQCGFGCAWVLCLPQPQRFRQPKTCSHSPGRGAPFPSAARARAAGQVSGSLQTGPGACLPGGRGWLLWGRVCLLSLPPPPTSSEDGAALLWSFSVPLFCEPPAVCSCQLIFPSLSHSLKKKSPSDCSQGLLAGPYPKECRRLLSVPPPLAGGGCGRLGVLFCWVLLLGT